MAIGTIVLCPDLLVTGYDRDAVADSLRAIGLAAVAPAIDAAHPDDDERTTTAHWVAHLSIALRDAVSPVVLVLSGASGALAPAVALSQRAARRHVRAYFLVNATLPKYGRDESEWPDAPVTYIASPAADPEVVTQAGLHAWTVTSIEQLSASEVTAAIIEGLRDETG